MKKLIFLLLFLLPAFSAFTQVGKIYFGKNDIGSEDYYYFEKDSIYLFSFLSSTFCNMGYSLACSYYQESDTIKAECIGDILIKKNRLVLIQKSASGKCRKTILLEAIYKEEIIKCLAEYGVIFKEGQIYVPEYMKNK
jgi:hypothetical protein